MSDSPSIIRQDTEHSVTMTEGSLVATSKPSDPNAPQVRQNLLGQSPDDGGPQAEPSPPLPPPLAAASPEPALVFERTIAQAAVADVPPALAASAGPDAQVPPPAAQTAGAEAGAPVFERSIQDRSAEAKLPPALSPESGDGDSAVDRFLRERRLALPAEPEPAAEPAAPVFERSLQDQPEPLPQPLPQAAQGSQGPVFERSLQDAQAAVPEQPPQPAPSPSAPVFERSLQEARLALPETAPALAAAPVPAALRSAPREGSSAPPAAVRQGPEAAVPEPLPLAQAQQIIAETAREMQSRVEDAIGGADAQWQEMDFPARVVKLKMENDKVRTKLDELEDLADRQAR